MCALHLLDVLFVEDFLDGDEFDDASGLFVVAGAFGFGVGGEAEGDEEAALAVFALHDGFEGVDVGTADLFGLLDLDGEPVAGEHAGGLALFGRGVGGFRADGEDASVDAHVADLDLIGDTVEGESPMCAQTLRHRCRE